MGLPQVMFKTTRPPQKKKKKKNFDWKTLSLAKNMVILGGGMLNPS